MPAHSLTPNNPHKWQQHFLLNLPAESPHCIWIHACSVGEVASIIPLAECLYEHGHRLHLTVITRTGCQHAQRHLSAIATISYLPWDLPYFMARFIRRLKPRLLLLTETEFWPGMLKACHQHGVSIIGINTRISDRSFPKYHATRFFWKRWLGHVDLFLPQSEEDGQRLHSMGVAPERIQVVGNLKYANSAPSVDATAWRYKVDASQVRPILLIASTHEDEEKRILNMWQKWRITQPNLLTIIVPRHPERFEQVAQLIAQQGITFSRWSTLQHHAEHDIILVDAMGQLQSLYCIADVVVIAGSLAPIGGHNPIEAAVCGRGVITGPHIHNFREMMRDMQHAKAAIVANSDSELENSVTDCLRQPEKLRQLHAHAALFMQKNRDVLRHVYQAIEEHL